MVRRTVVMIAGLALAGAMTAPLAAQAGTIRGTVADSAGAPLANATVAVEGTTLRAVSGAGGDYEIRGCRPAPAPCGSG